MRLAPFRVLAVLASLFISGIGNGNVAAHYGFSLASLHGSYAGIFSGKIKTPKGLLRILGTGIFVADGHGHLTGHETYTVVTTPCEASISGTYTINPDGSGKDSAAFDTSSQGCTSGTYTQALAIAQGGELVLLSNTNGDQIDEEWHLQTDDTPGPRRGGAIGGIATGGEQWAGTAMRPGALTAGPADQQNHASPTLWNGRAHHLLTRLLIKNRVVSVAESQLHSRHQER
jgi:hypothetical protein